MGPSLGTSWRSMERPAEAISARTLQVSWGTAPSTRTPFSPPWRGHGAHGGASRLSGNSEAIVACSPAIIDPEREHPRINKHLISVACSSICLGGEHVEKGDSLRSRDPCAPTSIAVSPGRLRYVTPVLCTYLILRQASYYEAHTLTMMQVYRLCCTACLGHLHGAERLPPLRDQLDYVGRHLAVMISVGVARAHS
jgi:hypothetical protein